MADNAPTPKKRAPARKPPTKAAALKALGLTNEDLAALKQLRSQQAAPAEPAPTVCTCGPNEGCTNCPPGKWSNSPEPRLVEASATLQPGSGFGGDGMRNAPSDPQAHLEDRPAPRTIDRAQAVDFAQTDEPVWYMRNLRYMEVGFRLSRQSDSSKKRTNLKPRGQRGDIVKLEPGDLKDAELQTQVAYQVIEIIPEGEALAAIAKQYTNHQHAVPAHIAALRNPLGKEYDTAPRTLSDEESMGYKVADLDPALMQGKLSDKDIKRDGGFAVMQPVQNPNPGRIVSDGFMAAPQQELGRNATDNEKAAQIDALARSKQFEGPGAGLGEVTVKVAPVQRS